MAKKVAISSLRKAVREVAAPFWERVRAAELDRFFLDRLLRGLLRRFREDRFARVKQGGLHGDARAELSRVFIDLDVTQGEEKRAGGQSAKTARIVASWMRRTKRPSARKDRGPRPDLDGRVDREGRTGVPVEVVLGGPGQGKSTVGRFLVLIHASILLLTFPVEGLVPASDIAHMEALLASLTAEEIPLPDEARLPIWVELRELASGLLHDAERRSEPLAAFFHWIAMNDLREPTDASGLESALDSLPWVLVLDGLDEVPPQQGRALVRGCVESLRQRFGGADGHVIATSRPQSYEREVFGEGLIERTLSPLSKERAEVYFERFAECLHGEEEGQRASLLKGMRKALSHPSTAALMTNPLLVTIMAAIVLHHGEPSDRRWTLFEEYYRTLYSRETERGTFASSTLRQHAPLIDAIHMHVGMSLQVRSEEADGVSALMPEKELRAIIREHVLAEHAEEEADRLTEEILRAAEQRLVLLVQSQEGMYGFDLRSFQELMAAWQIVSLQEAQATALLRRVSALRAWQNVTLFAIGHQYATNSRLKHERSVGLCEYLDGIEEGGNRLALPGARLALSVLGDAPYGKATKSRQELITRVLKLLRIPPSGIHRHVGGQLWNLDPERLLRELENGVRERETRETSWAVLFDLPEHERVQTLVETRWPPSPDERQAILRGCQPMVSEGPFGNPGPRLSRWARGDLSLLAPADRSGFLRIEDQSSLFVEAPSPGRARFSFKGGSCYLSWGFAYWTTTDPGAPETLTRIPRIGDWAIWHAAAQFQVEPTAPRLAAILERLADHWAHRSAWKHAPDIPWPLMACVMAAEDADGARRVAARLRAGELGDGPQWLHAEAAPRDWDVSPDDFRALATSHDPLRSILVDQMAPPFDWTLGSFVRMWSMGALRPEEMREIQQVARISRFFWVRRMIAQLFWEVTNLSSESASTTLGLAGSNADDLVCMLETAGSPVSLALLSELSPPFGASDLGTILTKTTGPIVYRSGVRDVSLASFVPPLLEAARIFPGAPRVQEAIIRALRSRTPEVHDLASLGPIADDTPHAWLLRFLTAQAASADVPTLASRLAGMQDEWNLRSSLRLLDVYEPSRPFVVPLIETLVPLPETPVALRSAAVEYLASRIASASAGLASPEQWASAGLPAPPPMLNPPERPELPGAQIASLEITNLRAFPQRFTVEPPPPADPGQWMVFLGENATGKTTLLRAIAMALATPSDSAAVPSNLDGPLRRDPTRDGSVRIRTRDGRDLTTIVSGIPGDERVVASPPIPENALRPWVVGYGCRRGSAVSGTDMDNAFAPFRDLDNLFERPRGVIRASGWLKELQRLAKNNGKRSKDIYEAARQALRGALLGAEDVLVENEVSVVFEGNRRVPLALLSDGYLTTAGWIVDLMARWLKRNEGRKTIDDRFCAAMEGVVLLDEIDLHLHPRWQERVIEDVRKLFPRMTFIATTHHPLTLRGARKGEVFILGDHDGTGSISAIQRDIPPGTRVDELITGEWFNRPSAIVDEDTRQMLEAHQRLILAGAKAGSPERKTLEAKLRERLGRFADTSLERLAATIVAQHLDTALPEPSAQQREKVRKDVLEILQRREKKRR